MEKIIKVGIGVLLIKNNQILLGHRIKDGVDTGGIYEPDTWCLPGGKQEYHETIFEGAIREVKEETNLNISQIEVFNVVDDIQLNKHYVTIHIRQKYHLDKSYYKNDIFEIIGVEEQTKYIINNVVNTCLYY